MMLKEDQLDWHFKDIPIGLSARRIWEHTQLRQVNPFLHVTKERIHRPENFIDVIIRPNSYPVYWGCTLLDLMDDQWPYIRTHQTEQLLSHCRSANIISWLRGVTTHLEAYLQRKAVRNRPEAFLPVSSQSPVGIQALYCALDNWLSDHSHEKATPTQWYNRIQNLSQKGLKKEEITSCGADDFLLEDFAGKAILDGELIHTEISYDQYRLSIIPVVNSAKNHLNWLPVNTNTTIKRLKPKIKGNPTTTPQWRDPILGYWIDLIEWNDMLGPVRCWIALTQRGEPLVTLNRPQGYCASPEEAKARANEHAAQTLPKLITNGQWMRYRLTGGENYREWLVTLPYYRPTYFSSHFSHRNVLLHIRTDIREGADGEKVLFVQELQSDWAQQARRELAETDKPEIPRCPWLQEWSSLGLKLLLLHAAHKGVDTLAWTTGQQQVKRYDGLGEEGLRQLYDRTLPKQVERLLRPHGVRCEPVDVYLPTNFWIDPVEDGYEILNEDGEVVGNAPTWRQAQKLIPDGAHELLSPMHGVRLKPTLRQKILDDGYAAWGNGI
jgi:hypothetical protein